MEIGHSNISILGENMYLVAPNLKYLKVHVANDSMCLFLFSKWL